MHRTPVSSSAIASIGYNAGSRMLEVEFTSGSVFRYFEVEQDAHEDFLEAPSKGAFFNARIRDAYPFTQMDSASDRRGRRPARR
jgi:lysyl-tRNA synthetase class 2